LCTLIGLGLGAIPLGSKTAFTDLAGSFIILTSTSYALAIAPNLFTGRKNVPKGPFHLGKFGYPVNAAAVLFIVFFDIMYCFRKFSLSMLCASRNHALTSLIAFGLPVTTPLMNYNSVILAGVVALTAIWWFIHGGKKYPGPHIAHLFLEGK
jgi:hypothetical protein